MKNPIWYLYLGIFLTLSIYHFMVYLGRREEKINLYYSLVSIGYIIWQLVKFITNSFIDSVFIKSCLMFFSLLLISFAYILIIYFALEIKKIKKYILIGFPLLLILPVITGILLFYYFKNFIISGIIIAVPGAVFNLFIWIVSTIIFFTQKYHKNRWKLFIYMAITNYVIFYLLFPVLNFLNISESVLVFISTNCILFWLIVSAYSITNKFNKEHKDLIILKQSLEKKVEERTEELNKAYKQKTDFFINLSHEIKTPLTLIDNYLSNDIRKRGESKDLIVVENNVNKLKKDIINFMDFEKLEKGIIFYNHDQVINFSEFLESKVILFKEIASKRKIKLDCRIIKNFYIQVDPFALDRIVNNLLDNAVKYSNEGSEINVYLNEKNNMVEFIVVDTGIGISKEQINYIFKPYHQISNKKRNIQGIGMGLNIVKKIMNELDGEIIVSSELSKGTVFKLIFKKYIVKENEKIKSNLKVSQPFKNNYILKPLSEKEFREEKKNILLVEDNIELLNYLILSLNDEYNVFTASNGKTAMEKIKNIPLPDIIISDIMMDEIDGYEFYNLLFNEPNYGSIAFIFLTARTSNEDKIKGLRKGAVDYITKPFVMDELKIKIKSILEYRNHQLKKQKDKLGLKISNIIKNNLNNPENTNYFDMPWNNYNITDEEKIIIKFIYKGMEYKEISSKMNITINAVKKRIHNIYKKLEVKNKIELIKKFNIK